MAEPAGYSIKTYRYLRMAMVAMVVLLGASLVIEWSKTDPHCLQTSISAYYYTPVQAIFVGALIAIGLCMVVLKGNTEREDILLNVAGILAPAVALVPTPGQGSCRSVPVVLGDTDANIANNMLALFVVGAPCLLVTAVFVLRARLSRADRNPMYLLGFAVALAIFGGGIAWFFVDRDGFIDNAHYAAAVVMFVCIIAVVLLNAKQFRRKDARRVPANRYSVIALGMVVVPVVLLAWKAMFGWAHAVLWVEGALITLFAIFWIFQTQELWNEGLREGGQELPRSQAVPSPLLSSSAE
ncbi:hypothetical protein EV652_104123 [Kribbella steppae]|uniref:DUF998 domain-containing protein n=1 Tax=Kribbella steppae TaxID=2512223 RepID=A0A4R2HNA4_9ACTN|nr:hypothetical protein [Kribbella steppae]TCO32517.1 hypothetical protein EV652_104123 [Kribbella steppae]